MIQVTAYEVLGAVHVLVQATDVTDTGRSYTCLMQELLEGHGELRDAWDLVWLVATKVADRADERADWHEIVTAPERPF